MKHLYYFFIALCFLTTTQCVEWGLEIKDVYKVSNIATQNGHPIQVPKEHTKVLIEGINGTIYADTFSQLDHISALAISSSFITGIEDGALCPPKLKQLEIDFKSHENTIPFTKNVFKNCDGLEELALIFNFDVPTKVEEDTLTGLTKLRKLILRNHRIQHLQKNFLKNLKLTYLTIFGSYMEQVDADLFEDMKDLEKLDFNIHALRRLPLELFKNTPKLILLDLSHGNLSGLTWNEFEGLTSLETLSLFSNKIEHFDAEKVVRYMPKLKELSIELNLAKCKELELFAKEVKEKIKHPIEISYIYKYDSDKETCIKESVK